ncbi:hypothetical protein CF8_0016 [Aeromonas phage CF8]|nr:hypothetical protein CF8_0016 [Aeromonas phage CF8]
MGLFHFFLLFFWVDLRGFSSFSFYPGLITIFIFIFNRLSKVK